MVEIKYKCECQTVEQTIFILERNNNELIEHYMKYMQMQIFIGHSKLSPRCKKTKMEYVKIYIENNGQIGSPMVRQ